MAIATMTLVNEVQLLALKHTLLFCQFNFKRNHNLLN